MALSTSGFCVHLHTHAHPYKCRDKMSTYTHTLSHKTPISGSQTSISESSGELLRPMGVLSFVTRYSYMTKMLPPSPKLNFPVILKLLTTHENTHPLWVLDVENIKESESKAGCRSPTLHHQAGMFRNGGRF